MNLHPLRRSLLHTCRGPGSNQKLFHSFGVAARGLPIRRQLPASDTIASLRRSQGLISGKRGSQFLVLARHESSSTSAQLPTEATSNATSDLTSPLHQTADIPPVSSSTVEAISDKLTAALDIPEPPEISTFVDAASKIVLNSAGEPTFSSIGLGGWTPAGWVQTSLEFLHIDVGMPWWAAILTGTLVVRTIVFPLVIKSQRNAAKMSNNMPQLQVLQLKMAEARQTGDNLMAAKYGNDMVLFMKEKDISPFKSMLVPLAMAPVFISFFFGLRKMANLPVESMRDGGLFWFTDLTIQDPYYLLPLITSTTLWLTLEIGADGVKMNSSPHGSIMKYVLRCFPIIVFPMVMNFPAALLCYWVSTNAVSLIQVSALKIPSVRNYFGIEPRINFEPGTLPIKNKGFKESFKDSWNNLKITREMQDRERHDDIVFTRAGRGPVPKTYKYDPTKVQAKSK